MTFIHVYFRFISHWRWLVTVLGFLVVATTASFLPKIVKDTSNDAFIDPSNPALVYRDKVEVLFGLKDPIVVAVIAQEDHTIFTPEALGLVKTLTERVEKLDNVDPDRVTSLATQKHIVGTFDGMLVEEFFEEEGEHFNTPIGSQSRAEQVKEAVSEFPLYQGSLVARDGRATIIVSELIDVLKSEQSYHDIIALVNEIDIPEGLEIHVAGEGAVSGYLGTYIDNDATRLNPIAGLVITLILVVTFFSIRGALLPNLIVLATVAASLGTMAAFGVSFYVITNGLVVNLIGIAVADSIHIFSQYYEELRDNPQVSNQDLVVNTMMHMWRPVTLTTVTTMAGFLALAVSADMPPIRYFGLFGALGVAAAWCYSVTLLPAVMSIWSLKRLPLPFRVQNTQSSEPTGDWSTQLMSKFGRTVLSYPVVVVAVGVFVVAVGITGVPYIVVNEARIENFQSSEPLYKADKAINSSMDGTYYLDVVVQTDEADALHRPENLRRIEALQEFLVTLPHVNGVTSVVDYIKQMHRSVNENREETYSIPSDGLLVSQLFFLYNASGDPTDFQEEVDTNYQQALVRANVDKSEYINNKLIIPRVEKYLKEHFNASGIEGHVTGRVNVDYHWIDSIARNHVWSVGLSLGAVFLMAVFVFRSLLAGVISMIPVGMSVLLVYAVMGYANVWLGVGTSMFAAIAIGLGIDFSVHTIDRIREIVRRRGFSDESLLELYPTTGRALFYNFLAVALGFGVLLTSDVPPLARFGSLVAVAVSASFLASMTIVPAVIKLLRPSFLLSSGALSDSISKGAVVGLLVLATGADAFAEGLTGREIVEKINARDEGQQVTRDFKLELTDKGGTTRVQNTTGYRKYFGSEKRTLLFYTEPTNVRGTGFLTFDYPDPNKDDDQWLYLPALRKIRRISSSKRGDYFLGTDLTYEEIKKEQKIEITDYNFEAKGTYKLKWIGVACC